MTSSTGAGGPPSWLPAPMWFTGDWFDYIEQLWSKYLSDFIDTRRQWRGKPVWVDKEPLVDGRDWTFWHISSGLDLKTKELKNPDLDRCARMCWVLPVLQANPLDVRAWIQAERGPNAVAVALPDFSYLVVLRELPNRVFLKSAYYVERESRRNQLPDEYDRSKKR